MNNCYRIEGHFNLHPFCIDESDQNEARLKKDIYDQNLTKKNYLAKLYKSVTLKLTQFMECTEINWKSFCFYEIRAFF